MPDLALCDNKSCPIKHQCYRQVAEPDKVGQKWITFTYHKDTGCKDLIRVKKLNRRSTD